MRCYSALSSVDASEVALIGAAGVRRPSGRRDGSATRPVVPGERDYSVVVVIVFLVVVTTPFGVAVDS
jgi:hypothetical protein